MTIAIMLGIIWELLQHKKITAKQIAAKYEISPRSVYRYIDALSSSGFPVITFVGKNGGISLEPDFVINNDYFSKEELNFLLKIIEQCNTTDIKVKCLNEKLKYLILNNTN
ncbi:MAG: HTH domain-containing protein [Clostridia bacterium]|nr:HTH domain-containing protein [Clostridia bacterium]